MSVTSVSMHAYASAPLCHGMPVLLAAAAILSQTFRHRTMQSKASLIPLSVPESHGLELLR